MKEDDPVASLVALLISPGLVMLDGWAVMTLWAWFVAPTFGVAPLRLPVAIGLGLLGAFISHRYSDRSYTSTRLVGTILHQLFVVGIGWVVKAWL